ncbi:MAG TPA: protease, partial [Anaerolineae bacterium]|nr:protease [Anaerolineae bacterium]
LENGNVDPNNSFLHHAPISRTTTAGIQDHTTWVASDAASFHGTYRGMAYGATVLSAGHEAPQADFVAGLQWAINQGARIVNISEGYEADNNVNWLDRAVDYWARSNFRALVKSAGNTGGSITTPGKAWNVITVGAADDNDNSDWSDDQMWPASAYVNPTSPHNDREKPEVVAVGANIVSLGVGDAVPPPSSGSSHAAPQVAGLVALLIHRNSALSYWPEAAKAIIMASATHNITGPTIIVRGQGDLRDGAGALSAALADTVAQTRNLSDVDPCTVPCWWGHSIDSSNFPVGTDLERAFYAKSGDLVRVAIAWWAHADTPGNNYSFDRLDTDLDLRIKDPNNQYVSNVSS